MFALSAFNNYVARNSKALIRQISINYRLLSTANTVTLVKEIVINNMVFMYEGTRTSNIFRTDEAIYTAVVVARSTGRWLDYYV
jgi:hypothetical protein